MIVCFKTTWETRLILLKRNVNPRCGFPHLDNRIKTKACSNWVHCRLLDSYAYSCKSRNHNCQDFFDILKIGFWGNDYRIFKNDLKIVINIEHYFQVPFHYPLATKACSQAWFYISFGSTNNGRMCSHILGWLLLYVATLLVFEGQY